MSKPAVLLPCSLKIVRQSAQTRSRPWVSYAEHAHPGILTNLGIPRTHSIVARDRQSVQSAR